MKIELENDGTKCTKFKINDKDFGMGISDLKIQIRGGEKPYIQIQGTLESLNAIIDHCNIAMRKEGKEKYKHIGEEK